MTTYSPSASTSEGKAPISSRMMSPPGVSTVKVELASASAAGRVDELDRQRREAVAKRHVDDLARGDLDVAGDDRIGRDARAPPGLPTPSEPTPTVSR